ncbi:MAG TPA: hypothetical protein VNE39_17895 [Planctomycetota bacterium]|nr:hypothetical protein [Planctomycetota bacterium]
MRSWAVGLIAALGSLQAVAGEAKLQIALPLGRTAYQTNETIDLAVVRSSAEALAAGNLVLNVSGADGSKLSFTFPVAAAPVAGKDARTTEHLHLNGWLLRPGKYVVEAACDGATASVGLDVFSHVRKSDFKLLVWGRAQKEAKLVEGEDSIGFNLIYGHYTNDDDANYIRAGCDVMPNCVMSGGHQMDLRGECDWSDPYVARGGTARVVQRALQMRTRPNVPGIHFYDEPGLTWHKHPETGEWTPHGVPAQVRAYQSAFGREWLSHHKVDPNNPDHVRQWKQWAYWKLGFMDAAWKEAQLGVLYVEPGYLCVTQSQYGWSAFTDGYYFNVVRSLPIVSGHGGYHDWGPGYFNPSYFLEMARARDIAKPCWYLPCWYGNTTSDEFRLEQYLSFQTNIQGMISPPDIDPFEPAKKPAAQGVVESNQLMARLGTIFTTMPVTRPPVAMLYSLSHLINEQVKDRSVCYAHGETHGQNLPLTYLAGKLLQQQFMVVVDEDIADGTLAANHKAVVLTSIKYLDPPVIAALEDFAAKGGLVLTTADCTVKIKGATGLGVTPAMPDATIIKKLADEKKYDEMRPYVTVGKHFQGATPLAKAIKAQLRLAGIKPIFECDNPYIVATRQAAGDIEYLFAVNAEYDYKVGAYLSMKPAVATIALPDDGRAVYDAVRGGAFAELKGGTKGTLRFGPGQMHVFARTARPIGSVKALTPVLTRDLTFAQAPIRVEAGATLLDAKGGVLSGSAPLHIQVIAPLGATRYERYVATRQGTATVSLPLAVTDPAGQWKIVVRELLSGTEDTVTFACQPLEKCGALAGATHRAVFFAPDFDRVHRFARVHRAATIVKGAGDYNNAAAERLAGILEPWDLHCKIVDAKEANKPRELKPEEVPTWVGIEFGRADPAGKNSPAKVGFAIQGAVILLGTPQDNPLIAHVEKMKVLPYPPKADEFPGRGHGYIAWQRDIIGHGQESIALIAYDAAGMAEAVGTLYEMVAGIQPLTPWRMPVTHSVAAATTAPGLLPALKTAWVAVLPDRVDAMKADGKQLRVLTHDDSLSVVGADGKVSSQKPVAPDQREKAAAELRPDPQNASRDLPKENLPQDRIVKLMATRPPVTAVAFWGGTLILYDAVGAPTSRQQMPQDITALAWLGDTLAVGLADGRVVALSTK